MKSKLALLTLVFAPAFLMAQAQTTDPNANTGGDAAIVQSDVRQVLLATYSGNVDIIVGFTYPPVREAMGGDAAVESGLRAVMTERDRLNVKVESLTFPEPPEFIEGASRLYGVVPTLLVVSANGQRVESYNFQVGIRTMRALRGEGQDHRQHRGP